MAPRIISPGEIRGAEVALLAFEAATTGHKVTTTLHVSDAFLWPERLELMDMTKLKRVPRYEREARTRQDNKEKVAV